MAIQNGINLTVTGVVTADGAGGYSGSSVTEFGVVVGGASNQLSTLPLGTATQVLTSNGAGVPPSYQSLPAGVTSVSGTTNRITSSGGATPVIDIDAAYVGQASITTLGTITTGVWTGTDIAVADGGTGASTAIAGFDNLSPTTTKGDLIVSDGTNNIREAIGTNGQVLTADSAQASGMKWATPSSSGGLTWNVETTTSATMAVNNGYFANNAALITFTLPTTAAVGDIVHVIGMGAGLFKIAQNASENISFPTSTTTTGTGGSITSLDQYASLELICNVANTNWIVKSSTGNYTIV